MSIDSQEAINKITQAAKDKYNIDPYYRYCIRCFYYIKLTIIRRPERYCEDCKHCMRLPLG